MTPKILLQCVRPGVIINADKQPYTGGKIQIFALRFGWSEQLVLGFRHPQYEQTTQAAQQWLNNHLLNKCRAFGIDQRGRWGLFAVEAVKEPVTMEPTL
jgi:hypothetical protein